MSTAGENITPRLIQPATDDTDERLFDPLVVTRLGGTLPFDTNSVQLDCGETITTNSGDMSIRLVMHCVCPKSQFQTLQEMRQVGAEIRLVSDAYSGPATFDELKFDRIPDANGAVVRGSTDNYDEPMYEVQLQSKEQDDSNEIDL